MQLTRDTRSGKIFDEGPPRRPIMLRGGHYSLFTKDGRPRRGLARSGKGPDVPFVVNYKGEPCVVNPSVCSPLPTQPGRLARELTWSDANRWQQIFDVLKARNCNLLRVWVMGGTEVHAVPPRIDPFDLFPFRPVKRGRVWKWQIYHAVALREWNDAYFDRLAAFAAAADAAGVCLQVTLFNYFDLTNESSGMTFLAWSQSPWNPDLSDNPSGNDRWGVNHLVSPSDGSPPRRQSFFINPTNKLETVQMALLNKVVQTLQGRGNIILEVMNEPRVAPFADLSRFNSKVIDWIRAAAGAWTPLISVNASRPAKSGHDFDTDWWREHSQPGSPDFVPNYDRVDIISYHGLTGFDNHEGVEGCKVGNVSREFSVPPVDPASIQARINRHRRAQQGRPEKKALMFSTDAARIDALEHLYCDVERPGAKLDMHVRDGQIDTHLDHASAEPREQLALKSDLRNWAYWCFSRGLGNDLGRIHLQNHSEFQRSYYQMSTALQEVKSATA
jgi:hypothetical protein